MRISDADRHEVAEVLRQAAGEGRIDIAELDERLDAAFAAKTYADLVPIVADLPGQTPAVPPTQLPRQPLGQVPARRPSSQPASGSLPRHDRSFAIMSSQDRKGEWEVGPTHDAFAMLGGITIDLRQAHFTSPEVVIAANVVMGGIDVIVDAYTRVVVEGIAIMGAFEEGRARVEPELGPDSPVVRVRGVALMGGVTVVRKPPPGTRRALHWHR